MRTNVSDVDIFVHKGTRVGKFDALHGHDVLMNVMISSVFLDKKSVRNESREQFKP